MRTAAGVRGERDGWVPIGTGIPGLTHSLSFRGTEFSIARSGGDFTRPGGFLKLHSSCMEDTDTGIGPTTITSVPITAIGAAHPIMWAHPPMLTVSTADPDRSGDSAPVPECWRVRVDSEDLAVGVSVVVASMEAQVSTAVAVFVVADAN